MYKKIFLSIIILITIYHGYAYSESGELKEFTITINPSSIHEDCFEMEPGDILDYSFESSKEVYFNIHYHEDSKIFYGIEKNNVISDKGQFYSQIKQYYCLMWTNPEKVRLSLTYSYRIKKK